MSDQTFTIQTDTTHLDVKIEEGKTIFQLMAGRNASLQVETPCGGTGTCGKCKAVVTNPSSPPNETERLFLTQEEESAGVRLICQCHPSPGTTVTSVKGEKAFQILGDRANFVDAINPPVQKKFLAPDAWKRGRSGDSGSLLEFLQKTWGLEKMTVALPVFQSLASLILDSEGSQGTTVLIRGDEILWAEAGDTTSELYGVAVDIGTTSVVAYLLNLRSGEVVDIASCLNPQVKYGADVVARIAYACEEPENLRRLQKDVVDAIGRLVDKLVAAASLDREKILHLVVAGNTTMEHLALGVSPRDIGMAPFLPGFRFLPTQEASTVNLFLHPRAGLDFLPNISGYIGGDTIAGVYYAGMYKSDEVSILVDIGTNNEVVLGNRDFLLACSTAAGPALEGAKIGQGMRGTVGAIQRVKIENGDVQVGVIGDVAAEGICGSGVIDLLAEMLGAGVIDESGKIRADVPDDRLAKRIGRNEKNFLRFQVCPNIEFTQKDVREAQLAKAAIGMGIAVLLEEAGLKIEDVAQIHLAGAFGNYIDIDNAIKIGLLPPLPRERIVPLGNAAGKGACTALLDANAIPCMKDVAKNIRHVELTAIENFQDVYLSHLPFGQSRGGM